MVDPRRRRSHLPCHGLPPRRARRAMLACVAAGAVGLAGCGGGTETVVRTVTVPVGGSTGAGASTRPAPPTSTAGPAAPATTQAAQPPLPGGRPAVDGTYVMALDDYEPPQIILGGDNALSDDLRWTARTTCDPAGSCRLALRRALEGGGSKNLVLEPEGDDDRAWSVETSGVSSCGARETPPGPYRVSLRATGVEDVDGRPTATRLRAYFRAGAGDVKDCDLFEQRSRVSYSGEREG